MNQVMSDQRVASRSPRCARISLRWRSTRPGRRCGGGRGAIRGSPSSSRSSCCSSRLADRPSAPFRSGDAANVELLFFPTGGGKTEAYLGLAAYTFAIRRLQGVVGSAPRALDGGDGVAVLMRYTLRLLTAQQFQRAAALVCAAELTAAGRPERPGGASRSGSGCGSAPSVSPKRFAEATRAGRSAASRDTGSLRSDGAADSSAALGAAPRSTRSATSNVTCRPNGSSLLRRRPWATLPVLQRARRRGPADPDRRRGDLPATRRRSCSPPSTSSPGSPARGRRRPSSATCANGALATATATRTSVGLVQGRLAQHRSKAVVRTIQRSRSSPVTRLRPPDLIIQDELHLITGALGTSVGVFENADRQLCCATAGGETIRPLIVASTATVRNAREPGSGAVRPRRRRCSRPRSSTCADTYFSTEVAVSDDEPGRRYLGVCAHGITAHARGDPARPRSCFSPVRSCSTSHGEAADPYMTTVGYFNATRELAGMRRYLDDDVTTRVTGNTEPFPRRTNDFERLEIGELTSRISSEDISATLDKLLVTVRPSDWSTQGRQSRPEGARCRRVRPVKPSPDRGTTPVRRRAGHLDAPGRR